MEKLTITFSGSPDALRGAIKPLVLSIDIQANSATIMFDPKVISKKLILQKLAFVKGIATNIPSPVLISFPDVVDTDFNVFGMTCKSCTNAITKALSPLPGIIEISLSIQTNSAQIKHDISLITAKDIVSAIEDRGFEASIKSDSLLLNAPILQDSNFNIVGMTCKSCINAITKALSPLPGVIQISISLQTNSSQIKHDISLLTAQDIVSVIEDCGFEASIANGLRHRSAPSSPVLATPVLVTPHRPQPSKRTTNPFITINSQHIDTGGYRSAIQAFLSPYQKNSPLHSAASASYALQSILSNAPDLGLIANLSVKGMTCASCVASIERHLKGVPGIISCKVALLAERADIEYNPTILTLEQIPDLINEIGFDASILAYDNAGDIELRIFGMTCASCSGTIEQKVSLMPGVQSVSVNLLAQTGRFQFDKKVVGVRDIVEKIESLGFDALLHDAGNSNAQIDSLARTKESQEWRNAFFKSLAFALPISIISMFLPKSWVGLKLIPGVALGDITMMVLTIPIQFGIGMRFHRAAYKAIKHGSATMDVLVSLGTNIAFFFSCLAIFYSAVETSHPDANVFFETSSTLITFIALGRWMENMAKGRTSSALSKLITLAPSKALLLVNQNGVLIEKEIPSEFIQSGDLLKVVPGERIPTDAQIEFGHSNIDESLVTGEPVPVQKIVGDAVIGGTVNGTGLLHVRATRVGADTTLSQIVKLVGEAQTSKAPIQQIADTISGYFVPIVIILGVITFGVWCVLLVCMSEHMKLHNWKFPGNLKLENESVFSIIFIALNFGISVIVVACPCALGLATPTAVMVGTGVGAGLGILIKGGSSLEAGYRVNKIIFDKTGTLTIGELDVVYQKIVLDKIGDKGKGVYLSREVFFGLVGACEAGSEHPLGRAICLYAKKLLDIPQSHNFPFAISDFEVVPGEGIQCFVEKSEFTSSSLILPDTPTLVLMGNERFLERHNISIPPSLISSKQHHEALGHTVIFVAFDKSCSGILALADALKPEAIIVVQALQKLGIEVAMVTGDQEATARVIAKQCGIKEVYAGVSPAGKKQIVSEMQSKIPNPVRGAGPRVNSIKGGYIIAMVGDGVNDSASIAQADLGIAVYGGSDVAVDAASVVLMRPDLMDVVTALDLSRKIFKRIRLNFLWATIYNVVMIPWAMGFFVSFGLPLSPMMSGMAMSFSSVSVVISSLLLKRYKKPVYDVDHSSLFTKGTPVTDSHMILLGEEDDDDVDILESEEEDDFGQELVSPTVLMEAGGKWFENDYTKLHNE